MNSSELLKVIRQDLFLPKELFSCEFDQRAGHYIYGIGYSIADDASMLSCGCCIAESLFDAIKDATHNELIYCPVCKNKNVSMVGPVKPLRCLYDQLNGFEDSISTSLETVKLQEENIERGGNKPEGTEENSTLPVEEAAMFTEYKNNDIPEKTLETDQVDSKKLDASNQQTTLLNLFFKVASKMNSENTPDDTTTERPINTDANPQYLTHSTTLETENKSEMVSLANKSNTIITERLSQECKKPEWHKDHTAHFNEPVVPNISSNLDEKKNRILLAVSHFIGNDLFSRRTPSSSKTKSKLFINSAISPSCTKFALIDKHKWEVFSIPADIDKYPPKLLFCGRNTGEVGKSFEKLELSKKNLTALANSEVLSGDYVFCTLSDDLLIISDTNNSLRVHELTEKGSLIHFYASKYPLRCIDIDHGGTLIACGITGRERKTNTEQALITLHRINVNKQTGLYVFPAPLTIALPYRDPINTINLSHDGLYISCSTTMESRFLVISLRTLNEPRLIMKSLRSIDTSLESEGITDTKLFPGNFNLMCVTSTAFNSPPIIINTKIEDISELRSVAQPSLLTKIVELGSKIHRCEISPRNDSIAFLDKNGSVYIMSAPTMIEDETKRIVLVDLVADAYRAHECASMRFNSSGHILYILDRKGVLYVEDFAYDLPQNPEVSKCKEL
ncbi:Ptr3p KNAG_0C01920 [Huiozyma naganishii CBS 8797]|uniref:SPS-sensor component PTR3 n=1 Tax=Huiozyma naganishii (strain ATCC MYA-139 / BCRC 22969 / CBS 8797 / KCTC 17520 / NBRC 10181 / NCYC 3082 / Yp74L-3) TaxID=1071383 RepID=J7R397_HUIN7|nr:hypothetical protein KNAG_0C01920 [Kazachstania naganishii CBS 8797]CCK69305.1 hypothetical protein KNAG_0C01920 [Kazachstania naganishii CBS 8797]